MGEGQGSGLTNRTLGSRTGAQSTTLATANLPAHSHTASNSVALTAKCNTGEGDSESPTGNLLATAEEGAPYSTGSADGDMDSGALGGTVTTTIGNTGNGTSFSNMQPSLAVSFIFCLSGVYPSRN